MKKLSSLTIFFPAYNDAKSIPLLVSKAYAVGKKVSNRPEIMVVDDGSEDNTWEVLTMLKKRFLDLKLIRHRKNMGYGEALRSGFSHAKGDFVFYTDGDGQYDPNEIPLLVKQMSTAVDVVNGYKINRSDSFIRKTVGSIYNAVAHHEYAIPISDVQCDYRLIRRSILQKVKLESHTGMICLSLIVKLQAAGARFTEVGVRHYPRQFGTSQFFRPRNLWRTGIEHISFYLRHYKQRNFIHGFALLITDRFLDLFD